MWRTLSILQSQNSKDNSLFSMNPMNWLCYKNGSITFWMCVLTFLSPITVIFSIGLLLIPERPFMVLICAKKLDLGTIHTLRKPLLKCPNVPKCLEMWRNIKNGNLLPKLWEKIVPVIEKNFEIRGWRRGFAKFVRSLEQFIQTVKGQNNFW